MPRYDPLKFLPRRALREYPRRAVIYDAQHPASYLYLSISGRVKITSTADGCPTISRIVNSDGFFGEAALIGETNHAESAVALDFVTLMAWTREEIETQIDREPLLGIALSQQFADECVQLQDRIESMAIYKTPERVMLALLQLADSLGTAMPGGSTRVLALTHHALAEFVGTSREIVTFQLNRLRREGLIRYSRKFIDVNVPALQQALRAQGIVVRQAPAPGFSATSFASNADD